MRKTALLLAMILILEPFMSHTVYAAEHTAAYAVTEDAFSADGTGQECNDAMDEGSGNPEKDASDNGAEDISDAGSAGSETGGKQTGSEEQPGGEDEKDGQTDGEAEDLAEETDGRTDESGEAGAEERDETSEAGETADPEENGEKPGPGEMEEFGENGETDGEGETADPEENDENTAEGETADLEEREAEADAEDLDGAEEADGELDEVSFAQEDMEAAAVSYRIYEKAHETPKGYLAVVYAQAGAYNSPGKITSLTYTVDGQTYDAELVRDKENELRIVGFYIHKGITGVVKTISVKMQYTAGQGTLAENTYEASQRIQLINAETSMTYGSAGGDKSLSDGSQVRIDVRLYTGSAEKVKYTKVALRKTGSTEKTISGAWVPETQSKEDVPDPRYDADRRVASPYTEHVEGIIQCKEYVQEGTYDLILYQEGGTVNRQVVTNYLSVTKQSAVYDGGYVSNDDIYSMDNTGSENVTIWLYGIGLSEKTVPVLYQTIAGRKRAVTSTLVGYEPLMGTKAGAVYCLKKDGFKNDLANTVVRLPDGQVYDGSNKAVVECAYHFGECVYTTAAKETASGVLGVETHVDCDADKIMFYLAEAYVKSDGAVSIAVSSQAGEEIIEKTSVGVQKDAGGRLYAEVGKEISGYTRMRKSAYYTAEIYNMEGILNSVSFSMKEPEYHKSNLTVPKGCTWEICRVNAVPGTIISGEKSGKNVLTDAQMSDLKKYGPVRYKIIQEGSVISQEKAIFGAGKAPKREPTPEELVETGAKPVLELKKKSLTYTGMKIKVMTPEYTRKKPLENYYIQLTIEDLYGAKNTIFEKCNGKSVQTFTLSFAPSGDSYIITARIVYSADGLETAPFNTYGKVSKELIVTLKDPYETSLQISGSNVKILQGETDLYNVARTGWQTAHADYRKIARIELTEFPEDADVSSMKKALYYNQEENAVKLNTAMLDWSKLPAGQYKVRIEAVQRADKKPAGKSFVIKICQGAADMKIFTESPRYYKEKGKKIKIKTIVEAVDHTGQPIPTEKLGKLTFHLVKNISDMQISTGTGEITVGKAFDGEEINQVYVNHRGSRYDGETFKVTNVKCHIKAVGVKDISAEKLAEGTYKSYEINGKEIFALDDDSNELTGRMLKYSVKGPSVKVDKYGVIHTTGTAGKTTVTVMMNDGSKEKTQIDMTVVNDAVYLEMHYLNGGAVDLVSSAGDTNYQNVITLDGGNFICLDVTGSDGESVKDGTTSYKLKAKKGSFVDYGKILEHTKRSSGKYIYIPKSSEDIITLTDKSAEPAVTVSYRISIAAFERNRTVKFKSKSVRVYQTGAADTVRFILPGNAVDYTGYTAVLGDNYESSFKSEKKYKKYRGMDAYLSKQAVVEPGNVIQFNLAEREKLPLGSYSMKLYLNKDGREIAPISVKLNVVKNEEPKIKVKMNSKKSISTKRKSLRLRIKKKKCRSVEAVSVETRNRGNSYFKNHFPDYFEVTMNEKGQYYLVCKEENPKTIPLRERKGVIRIRVVDLAGITREYTSYVTVKIK